MKVENTNDVIEIINSRITHKYEAIRHFRDLSLMMKRFWVVGLSGVFLYFISPLLFAKTPPESSIKVMQINRALIAVVAVSSLFWFVDAVTWYFQRALRQSVEDYEMRKYMYQNTSWQNPQFSDIDYLLRDKVVEESMLYYERPHNIQALFNRSHLMYISTIVMVLFGLIIYNFYTQINEKSLNWEPFLLFLIESAILLVIVFCWYYTIYDENNKDKRKHLKWVELTNIPLSCIILLLSIFLSAVLHRLSSVYVPIFIGGPILFLIFTLIICLVHGRSFTFYTNIGWIVYNCVICYIIMFAVVIYNFSFFTTVSMLLIGVVLVAWIVKIYFTNRLRVKHKETMLSSSYKPLFYTVYKFDSENIETLIKFKDVMQRYGNCDVYVDCVDNFKEDFQGKWRDIAMEKISSCDTVIRIKGDNDTENIIFELGLAKESNKKIVEFSQNDIACIGEINNAKELNLLLLKKNFPVIRPVQEVKNEPKEEASANG